MIQPYSLDELNLKKSNIKRANEYFFDDLDVFLNYLFEKGGIKLSGNLMTYSDMKNLEPLFAYPMELKRKRLETKVRYMFVMDTFAEMMSLTRRQAGILFAKSSEIEKFNDLTNEQKLTQTYNIYIDNYFMDETRLIPKLKIEWKDDTLLEEIFISFKKNIDKFLSNCDKGYWYSVNELYGLIETDLLLSNIDSAKYGMMWIIRNNESYNPYVIPKLVISNIFDVYLRHIGISSVYTDSSNYMEEIGITTDAVTMFGL